MKLFGWEISRAKDEEKQFSLSPIFGRGGWLPIIRESFPGAWQQNVEIDNDEVLTQSTVFACMTLIASDIAKLRVRMTERNRVTRIWEEVENSFYNRLLRQPNEFQTRIQFWEFWMLSKLSTGNVYVLKERDQQGRVRALYILDPLRVQVLVSEEGDVFYRLSEDDLNRVETGITIPASEIIHDRMNTLFHPLIGLSPIFAAGLAATQSLNIQKDSTVFFGNKSTPAGVLTAPGAITKETAVRLRDEWQEQHSGKNRGKIAVLGDNLKFEPMRVAGRDSQLIEQLRWTALTICSVFHVPPYKVGIGDQPSYNNIQSLNVEYYSQALQSLMEAGEEVMNEGLELPPNQSLQFDVEGLLRMDTLTMINASQVAVGSGFMAPNEARARMSLPPVEGGETPYLQQQNFSLAALARRDSNDPFAQPEPQEEPEQETEPENDTEVEQTDAELAFTFGRKIERRFDAHYGNHV